MPPRSSVHVDKLLTDVALGPRTNRRYIATEVYPVKMVEKQSDLITEIDPKGEVLRVKSLRRAPGTTPRMFDFTVDNTRRYFCEDHSVAASVTLEEEQNADEPIRPFLDKTNFAIEHILLEREYLLKANINASFTSGNTTSPTNKWNNYTTSDPFTDISNKIFAVGQTCGRRPNRMALADKTAHAIANHPDILDRIKYTNGGVLPTMERIGELLAQVFMLDRVVIADDLYVNTSAQETAPSYSLLWGEDVFLYVFEPIGIGTRAAGAHFVWRPGVSGQAVNGVEVIRGDYDKILRRTSLVANSYYDQFALHKTGDSNVAAFLFTDTLE